VRPFRSGCRRITPLAGEAATIASQSSAEANLTDESPSIEGSYFITSPAPDRAGSKELAELVRGHWGIENRIHWVRDVTCDKVRSQIRVNNASRAMATLRILAIGALRIAGHTNIAADIRAIGRSINRALELLGL